MPLLLFGPLVCAVFAGLYLLLAGALSSTELLTAVPVAMAFTGLTILLRLRRDRHVSPPWPPVRACLHALASLLLDSGRVGRALMRALLHGPADAAGTVTPQPFHVGGRRDPSDAGRRGLVILGTSLAPNGFVLGLSPDEKNLLLHRLVPVEPSRDTEWPT